MALIGNLKELKLPNLIQLNCLERNTAKLTVIGNNNKVGVIYFDNGEIVHAELDPFIGEKAIYTLLELKEGKFKVENDIAAPGKTITNSWSNILLEGLRISDEKKSETTGTNFEDIVDLLTGIKNVNNVFILNIKTMEIYGTPFFEKAPEYFRFLWQKSKRILNLFFSENIRYGFLKSNKKTIMMIEKIPLLVLIEYNGSTVLKEHLDAMKNIISF
ncbi:MAG: DUF4388 domain-containing protein [Calditrichia bacterium]|nr:DUF4388 domain-containing protein [Calditrichia bacterium]